MTRRGRSVAFSCKGKEGIPSYLKPVDLIKVFFLPNNILIRPLHKSDISNNNNNEKERNGSFYDDQVPCLVFNRLDLSIKQFHKWSLLKTKFSDFFSFNINKNVERESRSDSDLSYLQFVSETEVFCGIAGIVELPAGKHIVFIKEREHVGDLRGCDIFKVTGWSIVQWSHESLVPFDDPSSFGSGVSVLDSNREHLEMLESFLRDCCFYYSTDYNITCNLNTSSQFTEDDFRIRPFWQRGDQRFIWNLELLSDLIEARLHRYILPLMDGFIRIEDIQLIDDNATELPLGENESGRKSTAPSFKYALISRRAWSRSGARYQMRGGNPRGDVANYVETEQIVFDLMGNVASFVQTRGSIPLRWEQTPGKTNRKPKPVVVPSWVNLACLTNHLREQILHYGPIVLLSLIDKSGGEEDLGASFDTHIQWLVHNHQQEFRNFRSNVHYFGFDFHKECRNNKYENLSVLIDEVKPFLDEFGFFLMDFENNVVMRQKGHFRTNCVDCLDRTNVVQSVLARYNLSKVMRSLGMEHSSKSNIDLVGDFSELRHIWADNADVMSMGYAGTGALKTDFTRTGKRSVMGMAADASTSVKRYVYQTFTDEARQSSIDLFTRKFLSGRPKFFELGNGRVYRFQSDLKRGNSPTFSPILLELNTTSRVLRYHLCDQYRRYEMCLSGLCQVTMLPSNETGTVMTIHFNFNSLPDFLKFQSRIEACLFLDALTKAGWCGDRLVPPSIKVFCGIFDLQTVSTAPENLDHLNLPQGVDGFVISSIRNRYKIPNPSRYSSIVTNKHHWSMLVSNHFSGSYECTFDSVHREVHTIAFFRREFVNTIDCSSLPTMYRYSKGQQADNKQFTHSLGQSLTVQAGFGQRLCVIPLDFELKPSSGSAEFKTSIDISQISQSKSGSGWILDHALLLGNFRSPPINSSQPWSLYSQRVCHRSAYPTTRSVSCSPNGAIVTLAMKTAAEAAQEKGAVTDTA